MAGLELTNEQKKLAVKYLRMDAHSFSQYSARDKQQIVSEIIRCLPSQAAQYSETGQWILSTYKVRYAYYVDPFIHLDVYQAVFQNGYHAWEDFVRYYWLDILTYLYYHEDERHYLTAQMEDIFTEKIEKTLIQIKKTEQKHHGFRSGTQYKLSLNQVLAVHNYFRYLRGLGIRKSGSLMTLYGDFIQRTDYKVSLLPDALSDTYRLFINEPNRERFNTLEDEVFTYQTHREKNPQINKPYIEFNKSPNSVYTQMVGVTDKYYEKAMSQLTKSRVNQR